MNTVMDRRSGCISNMSSPNTTQSGSPAFRHETLANHAFSQEASLQQDYPSYPAHGKRTDLNKTCAECFDTFSTNSNLEQHASSAGHNAFSCTCGAQFSRAYTLTRHINSMIRPGFSCELCDDKAFPRLDKLADHLRRWHRLGDKAFDLYKGRNSPPGSASPPTAEALRQAYPVVPDVRSVSMFDDFPAASNNVHYCISGETSVSPDRSTVVDNWWLSQPGNNTVYPQSSASS